jgi:hypothetical protein
MIEGLLVDRQWSPEKLAEHLAALFRRTFACMSDLGAGSAGSLSNSTNVDDCASQDPNPCRPINTLCP